MLWLALLSPPSALAFLVGMERFERRMLAAVPIRARARARASRRRTGPLEPTPAATPRALVPRTEATALLSASDSSGRR